MTLESLIIETSDKGGLNQFDEWEINWCFQCLTKGSHLIRLEWCRAGRALYALRPFPSETVHEIRLPLAVQSQTSPPASWYFSSFECAHVSAMLDSGQHLSSYHMVRTNTGMAEFIPTPLPKLILGLQNSALLMKTHAVSQWTCVL